ncbi:GlxA family transcriptional regulator [Sulfitobacter donghicola]|uniref:AraC family transcriptional regulator n=1 Tax=Sulfitobacter donghicola DSW-25 = KCTC 12864 = JCM 14565 TaxID=1300350 RepID=A0A073IJK7_9RHOB|nr:helix-turn-helix domain-containing protein [Sulfitobacter donghicola]KEJ89711.1 AraC family transcriptional regulator [Sulfitobacter donghicola DSW-25 = KCTC 12864 = JCM 14565]KIN67196.1 Transcriptional regulator, AraC family [Sulfitobacter donghicola DSW-25 = KCTC 12864 = JCM 14565]
MTTEPQDIDQTLGFEVFVQRGFNEDELTAVTSTLRIANNIVGYERFSCRIISDMPGLVTSKGAVLVRAEPAIEDYGLADILIVLGGAKVDRGGWNRRLRSMQRKKRTTVLLSDAATAFIRAKTSQQGKVTTHWRDIALLKEQGYYPTLTTRLAEHSDGVTTAAGGAATVELIIGLITSHLEPIEIAELGNRLLLPAIRHSDAEQPRDIADNAGLFDARVTQAIKLMETNMEEPLAMTELTRRVGLSTRHVERVFREVFDETPARFYKRLRVRRARAMIEDTLIPLIDVAVATGFCSHNALSRAVRDEYGSTPSKMRARKEIKLIKHNS